MADTVTTTLGLTKPEVGASEDSWGEKINTNFDLVDDALDGTTAVSLDIDGGTIDGAVIGGTTPAAGSFTTLSASTSITGTLATAAQPNVTSVGTLTGLTVSGSTSLAGASTSADISFGDNDKAIFGAGSDLQIYHDGSNSFIKDTGTGNLSLLGSTSINLINADSSKFMARFNDSGSSQLYFNGSEKLATTSTGIDVTGTVTADGLTVDGDIDFVGTHYVGRGSDLNGLVFNASFGNALTSTADIEIVIDANNTDSNREFRVARNNSAFSTTENMMKIAENGDISFYEDTGTTAKFFWDASAEQLQLGTLNNSVNPAVLAIKSDANGHALTIEEPAGAGESWQIGVDVDGDLGFYNSTSTTASVTFDDSGNVGIGTSNPSGYSSSYKQVVINGGANAAMLQLNNTTTGQGGNTGGLAIVQSGVDAYLINPQATGTTRFFTNNTERMRIDSSGNVGIGTSNPSTSILHLNYNSVNNRGIRLQDENGTYDIITSGGSNANSFGIYNDTAGAYRLFIDSSGNVGIGTSSPTGWGKSLSLSNTPNDSGITFEGASRKFGIGGGNTDGALRFYDFTSSAERMRIDSSGNLLVGKSSASKDTVGVELKSDGRINATMTSGSPILANRQTTDGDIAVFQKDNTTVGSIKSYSGGTGNLDVSSGGTTTKLRLQDMVEFIDSRWSANEQVAPTRSGVDLGNSGSNAWQNLYLSGGVVFGDAGGSGTSTSNKLDNYETGTFTPTAFGNSTAGTTTYASQTGSYTKVGDTVHVNIYISWSAMTGTGDLRIGGLPFTSSSASNYFSTGTIVPLLGFTWPSGKTQLNPIISASDTAMSIFGSATDSNSDGAATDSEIVALAITMTYKV